MELIRQGKVRDVYADGEDLILVASDRVSVYDVVLPTPIPDKGAILTQLSLWWFSQVADLVPNHVLSEDVPPEWKGRAIRCRRLDMVAVECIARGYLTGLGLESYRATGSISGVQLPPGLVEADQLPEPIFTPTTKAEVGHDEFITMDDVRDAVGDATANELERLTLAIYSRGAEIARERGVIIADTKFEFGRDASGRLILADEVLTPTRHGSGRWPSTSRAGRSGHTTSSICGTGPHRWVIGTVRTRGRRYRRRWWPRPGLAMWRSLKSSRARSGVRERAAGALPNEPQRPRFYLIFVNFPISVAAPGSSVRLPV